MARRPTALLLRVLAKVILPANYLQDCWGWSGAHSRKRRGVLRPAIQRGIRGTSVVHVARIICELVHGEPPTSAHEAGHTCPKGERAGCISPFHLQWMTRAENEQYKRFMQADHS